MSYILDALRKSESERQQGRIPDLGQQVQLIHRTRKRAVPVSVWVSFGLILNAVILAAIFWPDIGFMSQGASLASGQSSDAPQVTEDDEFDAEPVVETSSANSIAGETSDVRESGESSMASPDSEAAIAAGAQDRPTVIVPSWSTQPNTIHNDANTQADPYESTERVPHLVELPMSFQRQVPTLIFNSHVYASNPAARRVMINDHYLRSGDQFSGVRVERITSDGVELSMDGRRFRVGVVRDWISPR